MASHEWSQASSIVAVFLTKHREQREGGLCPPWSILLEPSLLLASLMQRGHMDQAV